MTCLQQSVNTDHKCQNGWRQSIITEMIDLMDTNLSLSLFSIKITDEFQTTTETE